MVLLVCLQTVVYTIDLVIIYLNFYLTTIVQLECPSLIVKQSYLEARMPFVVSPLDLSLEGLAQGRLNGCSSSWASTPLAS